MARRAERIAILAIGRTFILFSIVGLVLPVLQGILFLLIRLALLSSELENARRILERLRTCYSGLSVKINLAEQRAMRWWVGFIRRRDPAC